MPQNPSGREFEHLTVLGKFLAPSSIKEFQVILYNSLVLIDDVYYVYL